MSKDCEHKWKQIWKGPADMGVAHYWCSECGAVKIIHHAYYQNGIKLVDERVEIFHPGEDDLPTCVSSYGGPWI